MIYYLLYPLKSKFSVLNVVRYITVRSGAAFLTTLILTILIFPWFIRKFRIKERISEYVPSQHKKKQGTPTSGGIVFISLSLLSTLLWARVDNPFVITAILTTIALGSLGFIDDLMKLKGEKKRGMRSYVKFAIQFFLAIPVLFVLKYLYPSEIAYLTQVLAFKNFNLDLGIFYLFLVAFVFIGTTNAVNITDGLDGLAASTYLPVIAVFILVAYLEGHKVLAGYLHLLKIEGIGELSIFGSAIAGGVLGFLWYNSHPAEVFMGDTGSESLGAALGIMAILTKQELLLGVAGAVFVIETLSSLLQIIAYHISGGKKRVFKRAPLHHHLELLGWSEPKIVARFWILSVISGILALTLIKFR